MNFTMASGFSTRTFRFLLRKVLALDDEEIAEPNQPIDVGDGSFISVKLVTSVPTGNAHLTFDGTSEKELARTSFISTVSLIAYGTDPYPLLIRVVTALQTSAALQGFKQMNAGLLSLSAIRDVTDPEKADAEERIQVDVQITHSHKLETDLMRFDTVTVTPKT